jgi:aminoglycoside phosphotransferase (APT) family kinase protein
VRLCERIQSATTLASEDRAWLSQHLELLIDRYQNLPAGLPISAVHGDAWGGNFVVTQDGPVILDLERFAVGPPEWDLTAIAVDHFTFGDVSVEEWRSVCEIYGYDVTTWAGYEVMRDIRELRKVTFAAQMAIRYDHVKPQAVYRVECLRGHHGSRPWCWQAVP